MAVSTDRGTDLLALHEAIQRGVAVDRKVLAEIRDLFLKTQTKDGGWRYKDDPRLAATMTMSTAGLCNLLISGLDLAEGKASLRKDGSAENCGTYKDNDAANRALAWIGARHPARYTDDEMATTFTSCSDMPRASAISERVKNSAWVDVHTVSVPSGSTAASAARGSR